MSNEILFLLCFNPVFTIWQFSFIGNEASWSQVSKSNKNDLLNYMEENDFFKSKYFSNGPSKISQFYKSGRKLFARHMTKKCSRGIWYLENTIQETLPLLCLPKLKLPKNFEMIVQLDLDRIFNN